MMREEAVSLLRRYKRDLRSRYKARFVHFYTQDVMFKRSVMGSFLCDTLISRIRHSPEPPIDVVYDFYSMLDDVLSESEDDHFETHQFASVFA